MIWQALLTPWTIAGGLCGILLAVAIIVGIVRARRQIGFALIRAAGLLFSPIGFFGLVIVVFLCISVLESGQFFNLTITHGAFFGLLGFALALGFDLVSVVCVQARLNATRLHDARGARLNLAGVCLCAAVSAFANLCGSLQAYQPADFNRTPALVQVIAPWLSMIFPTMIIVLSMTSDHLLDHLPARGIDVDTYRARERKRVELLQVRLETERALFTLEHDLAEVRTHRAQGEQRTHPPREWIWMRWLRPVVVAPAPEPDKDALVQGVQATQMALEAAGAEVHLLHATLLEGHAHLSMLHGQVVALQEQMRTLPASIASMVRVEQEAQTRTAQAAPLLRPHAHQPHTPALRAEGQEREPVGERILAATAHLGTNATDTAIAQAAGCSRTTVARWRKRLLAQRQMLPPEHLPSELQPDEEGSVGSE